MDKIWEVKNMYPAEKEVIGSFVSQDSVLDSDFTLPDVSLPGSPKGTVIVGTKIKLKPRNLHHFEIPSKALALVDYTLKNVASSGDTVIALIVVTIPPYKKYNPAVYATFQDSFNKALKNFIDFAHSKSVRLEGKISIAEKTFDGLIFEVGFSKASALVIGCSTWKVSTGKVSHHGDLFSKELPPSCHVIVIYNSKCIYTKRGDKRTLSQAFSANSVPSDVIATFRNLLGSPSASSKSSFSSQEIKPNQGKNEIGVERRDGVPISESVDLKNSDEIDGEKYFTFEELCMSTSYFDDNFKLGSGGCGEVYLGILPEGKEIVIKKLGRRFESESSRAGAMKQMDLEIKLIRKLHHRYLINLLGVSHTRDESLIVMDYFPNGSLSDRLLAEDKTKPVLTWKQRVNIALCVAEAIKYLHFFCDPIIIHRDIKSANILLDQNLNPKVSDFGLARFNADSYEPAMASAIVGTNGYFAPDYVMSGLVDESTDVYSFGVVLFELLSAAPPYDQNRNPRYLAKWAQKLVFQNQTFEIADPKLHGNFVKSQFEEIAKIACLCTSDDPLPRPKMTEIVHWLESIHHNIKSL